MTSQDDTPQFLILNVIYKAADKFHSGMQEMMVLSHHRGDSALGQSENTLAELRKVQKKADAHIK